jgi:CRISPR-associated protein Cas5h
MELLIFDVVGRMAHFRKVYSTSTSLSYLFPPRTTVTGLIAGLLGFERNSYYDEFLPNKCRIAISILSPLRKLVQPVNYLNLDEISETTLRGLKRKDPRVPTSIEFILPEPPHESVIYRVFVHHEKLMDKLEKNLRQKKFAYPPSLGPAYCLAEISPCEPLRVNASFDPSQKPISVSTIIKGPKIITFPQGTRVCWESRVPISFSRGRKPDRIDDYICQPEGKSIERIQLREEVFSCEGLPDGTYGTFME